MCTTYQHMIDGLVSKWKSAHLHAQIEGNKDLQDEARKVLAHLNSMRVAHEKDHKKNKELICTYYKALHSHLNSRDIDLKTSALS